jgi:hypothetical protein
MTSHNNIDLVYQLPIRSFASNIIPHSFPRFSFAPPYIGTLKKWHSFERPLAFLERVLSRYLCSLVRSAGPILRDRRDCHPFSSHLTPSPSPLIVQHCIHLFSMSLYSFFVVLHHSTSLCFGPSWSRFCKLSSGHFAYSRIFLSRKYP